MSNFTNEMVYLDGIWFKITFDMTFEDGYKYKDFIMDNIKNIIRMNNFKSITFFADENHYNDWNVEYCSTQKHEDESTNKYLLTNFYSINYYDAVNNNDVYVGGFRVTREISENEYHNEDFNFTPFENLYFNLISGLLPENLSESEVNMLKENLGDNWFEELGYHEPEYKRSRYDTFSNEKENRK